MLDGEGGEGEKDGIYGQAVADHGPGEDVHEGVEEDEEERERRRVENRVSQT